MSSTTLLNSHTNPVSSQVACGIILAFVALYSTTHLSLLSLSTMGANLSKTLGELDIPLLSTPCSSPFQVACLVTRKCGSSCLALMLPARRVCRPFKSPSAY